MPENKLTGLKFDLTGSCKNTNRYEIMPEGSVGVDVASLYRFLLVYQSASAVSQFLQCFKCL